MGGHFGVYHEPDCDPATYTDDPGFLHSGGGSGCVVRDYFDDADVTCRFCVINRERWRKENPNVRNLDWWEDDSSLALYTLFIFINFLLTPPPPLFPDSSGNPEKAPSVCPIFECAGKFRCVAVAKSRGSSHGSIV